MNPFPTKTATLVRHLPHRLRVRTSDGRIGTLDYISRDNVPPLCSVRTESGYTTHWRPDQLLPILRPFSALITRLLDGTYPAMGVTCLSLGPEDTPFLGPHQDSHVVMGEHQCYIDTKTHRVEIQSDFSVVSTRFGSGIETRNKNKEKVDAYLIANGFALGLKPNEFESTEIPKTPQQIANGEFLGRITQARKTLSSRSGPKDRLLGKLAIVQGELNLTLMHIQELEELILASQD